MQSGDWEDINTRQVRAIRCILVSCLHLLGIISQELLERLRCECVKEEYKRVEKVNEKGGNLKRKTGNKKI